MVKVKICGITNLGDALNSVKAGCDALGFLFYRKSPRYIVPAKASEIIKHLPPHILKIGVFVNAKESRIRRIAQELKLDILQFHGNESPEFCAKFKGYKIIKVFRVKGSIDLERIKRYSVWAFLFDSYQKDALGGTGSEFNWELLCGITSYCKNIFLAGGLNPGNVRKAVKLIKPNWVDASSALEIKPGKKDPERVRDFIKIAKG